MKIINIKKLLIKVLETTPIGKIDLYAGAISQSVSNNKISSTTAPSGYLLCDGSVLLVSDYPKLAAVLGSTYGGNGTTTFGLPDFRGRTGVGVGTGTSTTATEHTLGQKAGSEKVTLSTTMIPAHTHGSESLTGSFRIRKWGASGGSTVSGGTGIVSITDSSGTGNTIESTSGTSTNYHLVSIDATHTHNSVGGGEAHNNMQPYLGINYIIYTGKTH